MKISRGEFLAALTTAEIGVSTKGSIEQSDCFVFKDGMLITFNDEIMVRVKSPLDFNVIVNAATLLGMLAKLPDEEIEVSLKGEELRIRGARRSGGLTAALDATLPIDAVAAPDKWSRIAEGAFQYMLQASKVCSKDESLFLTTVVHVTPERVEACDNFRMFRVDGKTGFPERVLISAATVAALDGQDVQRVCVAPGWCHFKTASGAVISARSSSEKYYPEIDKLLEVGDEAEHITLPSNLGEMVKRAEVATEATYDAKIGVSIAEGELTLTSRREGAWYRERKKLAYSGRALTFEINPSFLAEVLQRTRDVVVDCERMKMKLTVDRIAFIVSIQLKKAE